MRRGWLDPSQLRTRSRGKRLCFKFLIFPRLFTTAHVIVIVDPIERMLGARLRDIHGSVLCAFCA